MNFLDKSINAVYNVVISPVTLSCWLFCQLPFRKKKTVEILDDACPKFSEIPTVAETDKIDVAWPPAPHPVEALSVHDLFRANGKLIRDLCYATTLSEEEAENFLLRERQKFCVHGIIGARQTGASNEHEHQTQFS